MSLKETISVAMITYNQSDFIEQALHTIRMQKNVEILEVVIGDDASTDNTKQLIKRFSKSADLNIRIIERSLNVGPSRNLYEVLLSCNGEYIAILEGDDYWTDDLKLYKQLSLVRDRSEVVACSHRHSVVDFHGAVIQEECDGPGRPMTGLYGLKDFEEYRYMGMIGSWLFRNIFKLDSLDYSIIYTADRYIADITLNLILCVSGNIIVMPENMSASRFVVDPMRSNYKSVIHGRCQIKARSEFLSRLVAWGVRHSFDITPRSRRIHNAFWAALYLARYPSWHNLGVFVFAIKNLMTFRV